MHSLWSAAVQYINYGTGGAFELPTQSGTLCDETYRYIAYCNILLCYNILHNIAGCNELWPVEAIRKYYGIYPYCCIPSR